MPPSAPPSRSPSRPPSRPGSSSRPPSRPGSSSSSGSSVNSQDPNVTVKKVGLKKEFATKNGKDYVRTKNADGTKTPWQKVEKPADAPVTSTRQLYLARQKQAPGEPLHWSLVACNAENGDFRGNVYQVKGDALNMAYKPNKEGMPVNVLNSSSIKDHFKLVGDLTPAMESALQKIAVAEPPPRANNMKEVKENCQGWSLRVLAKCVQGGIVPKERLDACKALLEPIKK